MNILFISLGCDKNLVDSEYMIGMLNAAGYTITDDENDADVLDDEAAAAFEADSSASACFFSFKADSTSDTESDGEFIELLFLSDSL